MKKVFNSADILLPDFKQVSGTKWACIACDQYTSEPKYWENAKEIIGDSPSTLDLILPEVYLSREEELVSKINANMEKYLKNILLSHKNSMIYLERTQSDGKIRRGIIGTVDLEEYDYRAGAQSPIRATEGTVLERIPPRVRIRRDACVELPHVMLLIDDDKKTVIESITEIADTLPVAYDFDLMQNGGRVCARWLGQNEIDSVLIPFPSLLPRTKWKENTETATSHLCSLPWATETTRLRPPRNATS